METFRLIKVFLASPGDLPDERRMAKDAVDEINRRIAPHLGFRVELMAWEETLPGGSRSQDIINKDLDLCELFIGMMWKKWGTPPSTNGPYTSGFEEEFERSYLRHKDTGLPEMAMYFKEVDEVVLNPGEDIKKVAEDIDRVGRFRSRLIAEKNIHFKDFKDSNDLQRGVREKITDYLFNLDKSEKDDQAEESAKSRNTKVVSDEPHKTEPVKSPFSAEGYSFLKGFLEKTEAVDSTANITSLEVARFRLLSSTISKPGNDKHFLGVHDANIIYTNQKCSGQVIPDTLPRFFS